MKVTIMLRVTILFGVLAATFLASGAQPSHGCGAAWRKGAPPVYISEESAIIVWDQTTKTQHFIRKAAFQAGVTKGKEADFGFLVPTPTIPALAEVGKEAFDTISLIMQPQVKEISKLDFTPAMCFFLPLHQKFDSVGAGKAPPENVKVLHQQQVAGYDASVLEADDGKSLNEWLGKNGYASRPALDDWLDHYAKLKWKITAFKISENGVPKSAADELFRPLATGAVRMSFKTDKPFFPYREPEEKGDKAKKQEMGDKAKEPEFSRRLRIHFLGQGRMAGKLGENDNRSWKNSWTANTLHFSDRINEAHLERLGKDLLVEGGLPAGTWLTTFSDGYPQRAQEDLFFEPDTNQTPIVPSPIIIVTSTIYLPSDMIVLTLILVGTSIWLAFRKKKKSSTSGG